VDIDLCEQFSALEWPQQQQIAEELVATPAQVQQKLEGTVGVRCLCLVFVL
jgi:hypothetical protein